MLAWQRGIFAKKTPGSADFCIKSDSNALAEFSKARIGSEQVIKLYSNSVQIIQLNFSISKSSLKYEIMFHYFVCRSFPAPEKYAGAPAPVLRRTALHYSTSTVELTVHIISLLPCMVKATKNITKK